MVRLISQIRVEYALWYHKSLVHCMKSELSQLGQPKPMGMMQETQQATLGTKRIPPWTPKQNPIQQGNKVILVTLSNPSLFCAQMLDLTKAQMVLTHQSYGAVSINQLLNWLQNSVVFVKLISTLFMLNDIVSLLSFKVCVNDCVLASFKFLSSSVTSPKRARQRVTTRREQQEPN